MYLGSQDSLDLLKNAHFMFDTESIFGNFGNILSAIGSVLHSVDKTLFTLSDQLFDLVETR